jgi:hypothetical protein
MREQQRHECRPFPGTVAWTNLASGPAGQVRQAVRAGLYIVVEGELHAALLVVAAEVRAAAGRCCAGRTATPWCMRCATESTSNTCLRDAFHPWLSRSTAGAC